MFCWERFVGLRSAATGLGARALEEAGPRVDALDRDLAPADVVEPVARQL